MLTHKIGGEDYRIRRDDLIGTYDLYHLIPGRKELWLCAFETRDAAMAWACRHSARLLEARAAKLEAGR